MWLIKEIESK